MAKREKLYEVAGDRQFRRQLRKLDNEVEDLKDFHTDLAELVMKQALIRVPVKSGTLRDTIRASGTKSKAVVRAGFAKVPYAGPVHFGWATRPAPFMGWRGGPIRPNPFLYDALDERRDEVIKAYEEKIEHLTKFGRVPSTMWEGGRRR